jgi:hypothetical protein
MIASVFRKGHGLYGPRRTGRHASFLVWGKILGGGADLKQPKVAVCPYRVILEEMDV